MTLMKVGAAKSKICGQFSGQLASADPPVVTIVRSSRTLVVANRFFFMVTCSILVVFRGLRSKLLDFVDNM